MFFAGENTPAPDLYLPSGWEPPFSKQNKMLNERMSYFIDLVKVMNPTQRAKPNLTMSQLAAMNYLRNSTDLMVFSCDKNLGPAIIERTAYIRRCFNDHLLDQKTYQQLSECEKDIAISDCETKLAVFIHKFKKNDPTYKFLKASRDQCNDPLSYFYITAKIHKTPWSSRPIVSTPGSLLFGVARWLDVELQKIVHDIDYVTTSSYEHRLELERLPKLPMNAKVFTLDAQSMYTNIDTTHALEVFKTFFTDIKLDVKHAKLLLDATELVMRNNIFAFGDTYWLQLTGTAMGTPPAPMYATLYYYIHERTIIPKYQKQLIFYRRYIDDGNGIWIPHNDPAEDNRIWNSFQQDVNNFGKLRWDFSERSTESVYLDLIIRVNSGVISCCMNEKELNLYLYIPPHSAHPPGVLLSLISGRLQSIYRLTTSAHDRRQLFERFVRRLTARGYQPSMIRPLFMRSLSQIPGFFAETVTSAPVITQDVSREADPPTAVFAHVLYHPKNPPNQRIQSAFEYCIRNPPGETPLDELCNYKGARFGHNRLLIAQHRPRNLKNILSPRKLRNGDPDTTASVILNKIRLDSVCHPEKPIQDDSVQPPRRSTNPFLERWREQRRRKRLL